MADARDGGDGSVGGDGGGDSLGGTVACFCVGADRLTEVTELVVAMDEGGGGSVGGDSGGDAVAGSAACVCVGADRLTEVTEVRWLTHGRDVTKESEVTVVETLWLAPLLVSVSVQAD